MTMVTLPVRSGICSVSNLALGGNNCPRADVFRRISDKKEPILVFDAGVGRNPNKRALDTRRTGTEGSAPLDTERRRRYSCHCHCHCFSAPGASSGGPKQLARARQSRIRIVSRPRKLCVKPS